MEVKAETMKKAEVKAEEEEEAESEMKAKTMKEAEVKAELEEVAELQQRNAVGSGINKHGLSFLSSSSKLMLF